MKDRARFGSTMLALSLALKMYGRELTKEMSEVYWAALAPLSDDEFEHAAATLIQRETEFPPPAMFLELTRRKPDTMAEAHAVMCRALLLTDYDPEGGTTWRPMRIRDEIGVAAYEAFLACGGAPGFRDYDSPFHGARVRRDFCEVYSRAVTADPSTALPAEVARPLLTTGQILLEAEAVKTGTLDQVRAQFLAQQGAERAELLQTFTKPEPLSVPTAEEQAALDRLGEKIAAKKRELAALISPGETP